MYHANIVQKKEVIVLDKIDFKAKETGREKGTLYNDKKVNPPKRHRNPKCVRTKQQNYKISETKTDGTKEGKKQNP